MEVSHVDDKTTHIVMSSQQSMAVTILDSPELMTLLSGALYKNPAYAMVREVICNAQDAHIEAGIPDTPIEISFLNNRLIIGDFGPGIPRDKMAEIYGTYGLSTKKKQKDATGGFGLGSKSPWSFTEIFGVTSCNNGTKTVYRLVRSDPENDGKPGIIPILDTETKESGLEVSIPLGSSNRQLMERYIKTVVMLGDIPARLDGELLDTIPFNQAKKGFTFVSPNTTQELKSHISVRYGSVIYPLENHEYYKTEYDELLAEIRSHSSSYREMSYLVLHAEPNTLSIAPSRDHLTLEARTTKTIKALLKNMINVLSEPKDYEQDIREYFKKNPEQDIYTYSISYAQTRKDYELMTAFVKYPSVLMYIKLNNNISEYFRKQEIKNTKLFKTFPRCIGTIYRTSKILNSWVNRYCYSPLYQWQQETSHKTSLYIWGKSPQPDKLHGPSALRNYFTRGAQPCECISLIRKIVVLTTCITDLPVRISSGRGTGEHVWIVTTRSKKLEVYAELAESLRSRGFEVIDLATENWVAPEPRRKRVPKVIEQKEEKPKGYLRLTDSFNIWRETYSRQIAIKKQSTLLEAPVAYIEEKNKALLWMVGSNHRNMMSLLDHVSGADTAVVSKKEEEELIKEGIPHFFEHAAETLNQLIKENRTEIRKYLSTQILIDTLNTQCFPRDFPERESVSRLLGADMTRNALGISGPTSSNKMGEIVGIHRWLQKLKTQAKFNVFSGLAELPKPRDPSEKMVAKVAKCVRSPHINLFSGSFMYYLEDIHLARKLINILLDYETEEQTNDD